MPKLIVIISLILGGVFDVFAQSGNEVKCNIISPNTLSKFFFEKVGADLSKSEIIFPTREKLNQVKSDSREDKIIRELWNTFLNWSSIEFTKPPENTKYIGINSCVLSFDLLFDLNHRGFKERVSIENLVLQPVSSIPSSKENFPFTVQNRNWQYLMMGNDKMLLSKILQSFKRSLLLLGKWGDGSPIPFEYRTKLQDILNTYVDNDALSALQTEKYGSVRRYFLEEYPADDGTYTLSQNRNSKISINKVNSNTFRVTSSVCNAASILVKRSQESFYDLYEDISKFELQFNCISVIIHESKNKCFPSGEYFISKF